MSSLNEMLENYGLLDKLLEDIQRANERWEKASKEFDEQIKKTKQNLEQGILPW